MVVTEAQPDHTATTCWIQDQPWDKAPDQFAIHAGRTPEI